MNGAGRPSLYKSDYAEHVHGYCLLGATNGEIAGYFGVAPRTVDDWPRAHPAFAQAVHSRRDVADAAIARPVRPMSRRRECPVWFLRRMGRRNSALAAKARRMPARY